MARRSSPAPGTGADLELSLDVSSIQDPVQAKLEELVAISRSNSEKLQQLLENPKTTPGRRPAKKAKVSKPCSAVVRRTYTAIAAENTWTFDDSFLAPENQQVTDVLIGEVLKECGDKYSRDDIREGCKVYWRSLRDKTKRMEKGTNDQHIKRVKRNYRISAKLSHRLSALDKIDWDAKKKEKVKEVLTSDYMSSEEDGEGEDRHCLLRVPLPWESNRLRRYKESLDKVYLENSSRHAIAQQKQRKNKETASARGVPEKAPGWAVTSNDDTFNFNE